MERENRESRLHRMGSSASNRNSYPVGPGSSYRQKEINATEEYVDYEDDDEEEIQYVDCPFEQLDSRQNKTPRITTNREQFEELQENQSRGGLFSDRGLN